MNTKEELVKELSRQEFSTNSSRDEALDLYRRIAGGYARIENAIAVLSDMQQNVSYIYAGRFGSVLGMGTSDEEHRVPSIWEENIFKLIHPDDLSVKHLEELMFFHFVRRIQKNKRKDYYLMSRIRMKTPTSGYIPALHRMFYISDSDKDSVWLALCLYSPLTFGMNMKCCAANSIDGSVTELRKENTDSILTARERQILGFIEKGCASKDIANILCISKNTVSRHRQEILSKLQVKNSIEACRLAKDLKIL